MSKLYFVSSYTYIHKIFSNHKRWQIILYESKYIIMYVLALFYLVSVECSPANGALVYRGVSLVPLGVVARCGPPTGACVCVCVYVCACMCRGHSAVLHLEDPTVNTITG